MRQNRQLGVRIRGNLGDIDSESTTYVGKARLLGTLTQLWGVFRPGRGSLNPHPWEQKGRLQVSLGALVVRIGLWGILCYDYHIRSPPPKKKKKNCIGNYLGPLNI